MSWVLAIDFGSTNTAAAWAVAGRIERVRLEPGSDTMPSAVVLADGQWRVGQAALNARRSHPRTFVASPKARLGHEPVVLGDKFVPAPVIASIVLATVRDRAIRAAGGTPPDRVVLTHPEHWGPQRQAALQEAARLAGFTDEQITMLPEPIAAVRASIEPTSLPPGSRVGVVDVGGGTCDVAVLESTADRGLVVLAREGDERLGGNDFDDLLYQWVLDQLRASNHGDMVQILADPAHIGAALTLLDSVRGAKQDLSDHADAQIAVSVAADNETVVTITRDEYEQLIAEPLERAAALTRQALESSKTAKLTQLFLTGGSAYTPALARALHKVTGHLSTPLGDPKMATATGALRTVLHIAPPAPQKAPAPPVAPADPAPAPAVSDAPAPAPAPPVPSGTDPRSSEGQTAPPQDATTQPAPTQVAAAPVPGATPPTAVIQPVGAPQKASMPQGVYPGPPTPTQPTSPRPMTASPPTHPGPPHAPIDNTRPPKNPNRWRNRVLLMTIPAVVTFGLGVYLGATASVFDGATPVQTVPGPTTTVTVNPSAPAGSNPSPTGGQEDPAAREENLPGGKAAALTLDKHVASTPGCVYGGSTFGESSATIAHTYQRTALICNFYYGNYQSNQHPSLDYLVPTGATTFTASVGLDDSSVLTTATYRFDVIDVTSNNSLWSQDVRYGELVPVSVNVEGLLRIRLEVSMVAQGGGSGQAWVVWGDPRLL